MKKQKMKTLIPLFAFMMMLLASCGKEIFNPIRKQTTDTTNPVTSQRTSTCSQHTLVRPAVDILFLWDNSTSTFFMKDEIKKSLNSIVDNVSSRFDYHIVMAPLVKPNNSNVNYELKLISRTTDGLSASALSHRVNYPKASDALSFSNPTDVGTREAGLSRISELLKENQTNGIFRKDAYTILVVMANQDDNSWVNFQETAIDAQNYVKDRVHELMCMRGNYTPLDERNCNSYPQSQVLNSKMMRLISIVPQVDQDNGQCNGVSIYRNRGVYEWASHRVFTTGYNNGNPQNSIGLERYPSVHRGLFGGSFTAYDTVSICSNSSNHKSPSNVFDTVNNLIQDTVVKHTYRYWPVAGAGVPVDGYTVRVVNNNGTYYQELDSSIQITRDPDGKDDYITGTGTDPINNPKIKVTGWRYICPDPAGINCDVQNDTRFLPTVGEPFYGKMIELFGEAKVTYPTCLIVSSNAPVEYYGYVYVGTALPLEDKIELRINGTLISKSSTNGWTLDPVHSSGRNIKIVSPTNTSPAYPEVMKPAGYYLKVHGSAIYSNSASVDVRWLPTAGQ